MLAPLPGHANNVSVWDSNMAIDIVGGLYPIGGASEVNGSFVTEEYQDGSGAFQIGIRAKDRATGLPANKAGVVFLVQEGEFAPGEAFWNYDLHLDFGTAFLGADLGQVLPKQSMAAYTVRLQVDVDPGPGTSFVTTVIPAIVDPILLLQTSQNIGTSNEFGGPHPLLLGKGDYRIRLSVSNSSEELAAAEMRIISGGATPVPTLSASALSALVLMLMATAVWRLRKRRTVV